MPHEDQQNAGFCALTLLVFMVTTTTCSCFRSIFQGMSTLPKSSVPLADIIAHVAIDVRSGSFASICSAVLYFRFPVNSGLHVTPYSADDGRS